MVSEYIYSDRKKVQLKYGILLKIYFKFIKFLILKMNFCPYVMISKDLQN